MAISQCLHIPFLNHTIDKMYFVSKNIAMGLKSGAFARKNEKKKYYPIYQVVVEAFVSQPRISSLFLVLCITSPEK